MGNLAVTQTGIEKREELLKMGILAIEVRIEPKKYADWAADNDPFLVLGIFIDRFRKYLQPSEEEVLSGPSFSTGRIHASSLADFRFKITIHCTDPDHALKETRKFIQHQEGLSLLTRVVLEYHSARM